MKRGVVTVLSVDGGGVRGLIPALIVEDLFRRIRFIDAEAARRTPFRRRRVSDSLHPQNVFDLFAGTSTGALLALGFAKRKPMKPSDLVEIYRRYAATIFPVNRFTSIRAMRQAFAEKYDAAPLESVLAGLFGDDRLSECAANVLVAAYDTANRGPFFFKHYADATLKRNATLRKKEDKPEDFLLRDVARATSAAPTYFVPASVRSFEGTERSLLDGGLVANNPALAAYVEARKIAPDARRYVIVSLGTGRNGRRFTHKTIAKWGYIDWVSPVHGVPMLSFMSDGQSKVVAHTLKNLPRVAYYRFNADITAVAEEMDDARPRNMRRVEEMARAIIRENSADLHRLAKLLYRERILRHRGGIAVVG